MERWPAANLPKVIQMDRRGHALQGMHRVSMHVTRRMRERLCEALEELCPGHRPPWRNVASVMGRSQSTGAMPQQARDELPHQFLVRSSTVGWEPWLTSTPARRPSPGSTTTC
jgi:hypothetical protein